MEDVEEAAAVGLCLMSLQNYINELKKNEKNRKRRKRRCWMTSIHRNRTLSSMEDFFTEFVESGELTNSCRMSTTDFEFLLNQIKPMITKRNRLRSSIPPKIRLAIALRYLATGDSYRSLNYLFKVSVSAISQIVPEVCKAINFVLKDQIKLPRTQEEWLTVEEGFRRKFPRCIGAIDGKHILVQCPMHTGSTFYNYKRTYSIVLLALVDSDYRFLFADIGGQERISDGGIFQNSLLYHKINNGEMNFPPDIPLPGREECVPYVFLADGAFALQKHIMKPFPGNHDVGTVERNFNHKLSCTRAIVENVFGALTSAYRVFSKPIEIDVKNVPVLTMTCILLHNFLRKSDSSRNIYTPPGTFDTVINGQFVGGSWRDNIISESSGIRPIPKVSRRGSVNASKIRLEFANFFHVSN